jgi:molybdate transport system permease protein
VFLAWLLARGPFPGCELLDAAASLPLVLPPAVLVYYLIAAQGRWPVVFNWHAAVALSTACTLPLVLWISRPGFEAVDRSFENAARGLGASDWRVLWRITIPLVWRALLAAALAGFARSLADFGLTIMVAAGVAGVTTLALLALAIAIIGLGALYLGNRMRRGRAWA